MIEPPSHTCDTGHFGEPLPVKTDRERVGQLRCTRAPGTGIDQRQIAVLGFFGQFHTYPRFDLTHMSYLCALTRWNRFDVLIKAISGVAPCGSS